MRARADRTSALDHELSSITTRMAEPGRSPLLHITVLRSTYASCSRRGYAEHSSTGKRKAPPCGGALVRHL